MKKQLHINLWLIKRAVWIIASILFMILLLSACGQNEKRNTKDSNETLEDTEYEFLIFYDPSAQMLLQSFRKNHPEIDIHSISTEDFQLQIDQKDKLNQGAYLEAMIQKYGSPDLILGGSADKMGSFAYNLVDGIDMCDLPRCYEKGYIADLSLYCAEDASVDIDMYFPGTFDVFRDENHLYALPLGISMDFFVTTETKYNQSAFADLQEGYSGRELLEIMKSEIEKERDSDEFFCPESISFLDLLYQLGGVRHSKDGIQVDKEIFQQVYEFTSMSNKQAKDKRERWMETGDLFTIENGFAQFTAFEPRAYEGKFSVSFWRGKDAPAIALAYATTANAYHIDEETKAIYIPNYHDGNSYTARVEVYGAVGAQSAKPDLAYELLRLLMDVEITSFNIPDDFAFYMGHSYNLYPVNKEKAQKIWDCFEAGNVLLMYGHQGNGRYIHVLNRVTIRDEEKEKHAKMLNGITEMTYSSNAKREAVWLEDIGNYDDLVKALNAN